MLSHIQYRHENNIIHRFKKSTNRCTDVNLIIEYAESQRIENCAKNHSTKSTTTEKGAEKGRKNSKDNLKKTSTAITISRNIFAVNK